MAASFLPGLLAGVHLGGLLFFLEPELPFEPVPVLRACLIYGGLGAAAGALLLSPLARLRPGSTLRLLPWAVTAVVGLVALLDSAQAAHYAFYLPAGINDRLLKKTLWLSGAALVLFYTALLHTLHRRPYGPRSRLAFWVLALASVYLMVERRGAYSPNPVPAVPIDVESGVRPTLLVVGLESATLDALLPMAEQGDLPFFASLLRLGAYGRLESFEPVREAPLWTTLATGKHPFEHRVLGGRIYPAPWVASGAELRLLPWGIGFPAWGTFGATAREERSSEARAARTLWEVLPHLGAPSGAVSWPALASPDSQLPSGEPALAFGFDERFFGDSLDVSAAWPERLAERAWIFRVAPDELDPLLTREAGEPGRTVEEVQAALAGDVWRQSVTRFLLEQREARAIFVRLPGLRTASRRFFGGYVERRLEGRVEPEYDRAASRLAAYYSRLDVLLAELWAAVEGPRLLVVVSPSGTASPGRWARGWLAVRGEKPIAGMLDGAPDGLLLLAGDGVRSGTLVTGAELVDLAPTILYAVGAPVPRDLDGRVLTETFTPEFLARHPLTFVPSYEGVGESRP